MNNPDTSTDISRELLRWYSHMGVDEALDIEPGNWFERSAVPARNTTQQTSPQISPQANFQQASSQPVGFQQKAPAQAPQQQPPSRNFPMMSPDGAAAEAREKAANAENLEELEKILREFDGCSLKVTAKNTCISRGNPASDLMLIGEAPGRDEDIQGRPFVGKAGQLLDKMLQAIGHDEENTYITNIVYWRPPGNRTPTPQEAQLCRPFLERQIELIQPKVIVFLGGAAAKNMLETTEGIMRLRGKWKELKLKDACFKAIATLHPAYLLRTPAGKKLAWDDLLAIKKALHNTD